MGQTICREYVVFMVWVQSSFPFLQARVPSQYGSLSFTGLPFSHTPTALPPNRHTSALRVVGNRPATFFAEWLRVSCILTGSPVDQPISQTHLNHRGLLSSFRGQSLARVYVSVINKPSLGCMYLNFPDNFDLNKDSLDRRPAMFVLSARAICPETELSSLRKED